MPKTFDYRDFARRKWPLATLDGDGPWCVLISCWEYKGVRLFKTKPEAVYELARINANGCTDMRCIRSEGHRIVFLDCTPPVPFRIPGTGIDDDWEKDLGD
jgi:hypothetical protein